MKRNMAPMSNNARARPAPGISALPRQVIPMERLGIELTLRSSRERSDGLSLTNVTFTRSRTVARRREMVFEALIGTDADNKNAPTILRHSVFLCIQN